MLGKVLVTGGAGCLGSHIIELLHEKRVELGVTEIIVLDLADKIRWASPEDDKRIRGYCSRWITGSITDGATVARAINGCDAVIHAASLVDLGVADKQLLYDINVGGTENILSACLMEDNVKALVYASSLDVVAHIYDAKDKDGLNEESAQYSIDDPTIPHMFEDMYCVSKTLAEKRVLKANKRDVERLRTAAIRPNGIYGERDAAHIVSILEAGRNMGSMMLFRFGDGAAVCQHVYVKNCAWMHILALKKLIEGDDSVAGQAFFGVDDTKVNNFFDFDEPFWAFNGYRIPFIRIPTPIAYHLAALTEDIFVFIRKVAPSLVGKSSLTLTRRAIQGTCTTIWFDTDKAHRLLGYQPLYSPMEARRRTFEFIATLGGKFPKGPYKYEPGQYDYIDDGSNFRPDSALYLAAKKRRDESRKGDRSLNVKTLGAVGIILGSILALGMTTNLASD